MKKTSIAISFLPLILLTSVPRAFSAEANESLCARFESPRRDNCLKAFKIIPNKKALSYTLRYLQLNSGGLKDPSCLVHGKDQAKKGIHNTCSFVINDLTSKYKGSPLRANAYYVDLCANNSKDIVKSFFVNKGTGTANANYADRQGAHSTNAGAYLTGDKLVNFIPYHLSAAYKGLKRMLGGFIPALDLIGLHSTNNNTSDSKPMHASPYKSSWGCPSVSADAVSIMRKLAASGPSLVMNYGPSQFHPEDSLTKCNAVPDMVGAKGHGLRKYLPKSATRIRHGHRHVTYASHSRHPKESPSGEHPHGGIK